MIRGEADRIICCWMREELATEGCEKAGRENEGRAENDGRAIAGADDRAEKCGAPPPLLATAPPPLAPPPPPFPAGAALLAVMPTIIATAAIAVSLRIRAMRCSPGTLEMPESFFLALPS